MSVIVHLHANAAKLPCEVFSRLAFLLPSGVRHVKDPDTGNCAATAWTVALPLSSETVQQSLRLLRAAGYIEGSEDKPVVIQAGVVLWLERRYSPTELASHSLLLLQGTKYVGGEWRTEDGGLFRFDAGRIRRCKADTVSTDYPGLFVPDRVRALIEPAKLAGLTFRSVTPVRRAADQLSILPWREVCEPWWELRSSIRMPPLSPSLPIRATDGSPFVSYDTQLLSVSEWPYLDVLLRYRAKDLKDMLPFDLAMTYEHIGKPPFGEWLIASQEVYQLFRKHKIKARWTPVIIED